MKQFEQFLIFYKQLSGILIEIENYINKKEYNEALNQINHQERIVNKIILLKQNIKFTEEESNRIKQLEAALNNKKKQVVQKMEKVKSQIKKELDKANADKKLNTAYIQHEETDVSGGLIDLSE